MAACSSIETPLRHLQGPVEVQSPTSGQAPPHRGGTGVIAPPGHDDDADRRAEERRTCADPVWWRCERTPESRVGWMLEKSDGGTAFVMRDQNPPKPGMAVELFGWMPAQSGVGRRGRLGFVRRVETVHDDLYVVAVQHFRYRPFKAGDKARAGVDPAQPSLPPTECKPPTAPFNPGGAHDGPTLRFVPAPEGWEG